MTIFTCVAFVSTVAFIFLVRAYLASKHEKREKACIHLKPLIASEYMNRIEKTWLEILENREHIDRSIVLWWGLDGLRLNEDGTLEWISRKRPEQVNQDMNCLNVIHYQKYVQCGSFGKFTVIPQETFQRCQLESGLLCRK